ncbi:putative f-box protein [Venturia nashicola]|uniref:Glycerophosphocholine acyltransferase 1 n=1 Tax=Venturia nashicola TaxID=86259 RepID=A0A4Z1PGE8_9PEZI|nr:putative f-box protein [Venturia nashicola]
MAVASFPTNSRRALSDHRRNSSFTSIFQVLEDDSRDMAAQPPTPASQPNIATDHPEKQLSPTTPKHDGSGSVSPAMSSTNQGLSRSTSFSDGDYFDESVPPLERLTVFDLIENLALPQRLERFQSTISLQTEKVRRGQERLKSSGKVAKEKVVEEWRRRVPTADEQLEKYKKRMRESVDRLNSKFGKAVTLREKLSFIAGVMNVFVSGYLVGGHPDLYHIWYTIQLLYFMPIRFYTYQKKGYHYFLADLCYFVNLLLMLTIWVFPGSKRLFIASYCLSFGNNAIAIAMWRNSLVFHSLDKVTSLFIHIMPCVSLHCIVHLLPPELQAARFPAVYNIITSSPGDPEHYTLLQMMFWASWPYAVWQLSYHFFISVRRRDKIAAGRPTSFTWLRKSFGPTWLGRMVLSLPDSLQEPAYMMIQYMYALLTMIPCPLWFWSRWASGLFLLSVFSWSVWNGATYYIDVFGQRFQRELEQLKKDVAKWQSTPDLLGKSGLSSPLLSPEAENGNETERKGEDAGAIKAEQVPSIDGNVEPGSEGPKESNRADSVSAIPLLDDTRKSGLQAATDDTGMRERK